MVVDAARQPAWVQRAWQRIVEEVGQGRQAFVVCARISASEPAGRPRPPEATRSGRAARRGGPVRRAEHGPLAGLRVAMLHGQLPAEEKDAVMARFAAGQMDVLVATTVVEVGVDVPNATVMVICDADRFGISQLHQLRGRIGRGAHPGVCLLLTAAAEAARPGTGLRRWPRPGTGSSSPRSTSNSGGRETCSAPASRGAGRV